MSQYFGPFLLKEIFYTSRLSCAFVNLRPVVKGHILVVPKRVVPRFSDLKPEEVSDLFFTVSKVAKVIEEAYKATSLSITIQDGPDAGQSVPHVHVHILPRSPNDFPRNDDIYGEIEKNKYFSVDATNKDAKKDRTPKEMEEEATFLSKFFK